ncbi:MAG: alpha/beta hydrolase [Lewinellaceae bacterium]|nr:alpha/beta hydrolase [Lewinellaceae bacterium]
MTYTIIYYFHLLFSLMFCPIKEHKYIQNKEGFRQFFVYDKYNQATVSHYTFGESAIIDNSLVTTQTISGMHAWLSEIKDAIEHQPQDKKGIVIYIHGYQADNQYFIKSSGPIIQKDIFDTENSQYGIAISLVWKSVFGYDEAVQNAFAKGEFFANIVDSIYRYQQADCANAKFSVIAHSMGNRVWEGLYTEWIKIRPNVQLNSVLLMAADLENNVFETSFASLPQHANRVVVYHNTEDVTLSFANRMSPHERLGIFGPKNPDTLPENIIIQNATNVSDDDIKNATFTRHRYFYSSPSIRKHLSQYLNQ